MNLAGCNRQSTKSHWLAIPPVPSTAWVIADGSTLINHCIHTLECPHGCRVVTSSPRRLNEVLSANFLYRALRCCHRDIPKAQTPLVHRPSIRDRKFCWDGKDETYHRGLSNHRLAEAAVRDRSTPLPGSTFLIENMAEILVRTK